MITIGCRRMICFERLHVADHIIMAIWRCVYDRQSLYLYELFAIEEENRSFMAMHVPFNDISTARTKLWHASSHIIKNYFLTLHIYDQIGTKYVIHRSYVINARIKLLYLTQNQTHDEVCSLGTNKHTKKV